MPADDRWRLVYGVDGGRSDAGGDRIGIVAGVLEGRLSATTARKEGHGREKRTGGREGGWEVPYVRGRGEMLTTLIIQTCRQNPKYRRGPRRLINRTNKRANIQDVQMRRGEWRVQLDMRWAEMFREQWYAVGDSK